MNFCGLFIILVPIEQRGRAVCIFSVKAKKFKRESILVSRGEEDREVSKKRKYLEKGNVWSTEEKKTREKKEENVMKKEKLLRRISWWKEF